VGVWVSLVAFQVMFLWHLGDGLNYLGDPHAEADAMRAAEAYTAGGLLSHKGLARILYGRRFPNDGTVKDHVDAQGKVVAKFRQGFPPEMEDPNQWVLTHYPPGAELANGLQARFFGVEHVWPLRLLPVTVGLIGLAVFFHSVSLLWGFERGALIALALAALPMVSLWMCTLEFEGYALALLLIQTSVLLRRLWGTQQTGGWFIAGLLLMGFVQGWLSWDHFFLVSLLAIPWWLLRRAEGEAPQWRWLFWATAAPAAGYAFAHILHVWEVAAELGTWQAAIAELRRTGLERAGFSGEHTSRLAYTGRALYLYARFCLKPTHLLFGPFLDLLLLLALPAAVFSVTKLALTPHSWDRRWHIALAWPGRRSPLLALVAAFLVCALWPLALPQHAVGNAHYTARHFVVLYIVMAVVVARSVQVHSERAPSHQLPATPVPDAQHLRQTESL
jgi:hypothetical protein